MNARDFNRDDVLERLRRESRDGVAPSSAKWDHPAAPGMPSKRVAVTLFGSWTEACHAAGLTTPVEAAGRRAAARERARDADRARRQRESTGERRETGVKKWQRERAEKAREQMREDIESGRLRVYQATLEQMADFAAKRAARAARYAPTEADLAAVPGVKPRPKPPEDEDEEMAA